MVGAAGVMALGSRPRTSGLPILTSWADFQAVSVSRLSFSGAPRAGASRRQMGREEPRRGGPRQPLRGAARVRHRRGAPGQRRGRVLRHRDRAGGAAPDSDLDGLRPFDLRPAAIIAQLNLRRAIYQPTAAYGHFGRTDIDLPWEHTDK